MNNASSPSPEMPQDSIFLQELSATEYRIHSPEFDIILLGTAHISQESVDQTEAAIEQYQPQCICVELDEKRYHSLRQAEQWKELDIYKTLKEGKGFLLLFNLLLASFQRQIGQELELQPGAEMLKAVELAEQRGSTLCLVDRPVDITLKRAWLGCTLWERAKLLNSLLGSLFIKEEISKEDIEELKKKDTMAQMVEEFSKLLPGIKSSLIDERDIYLARSIYSAKDKLPAAQPFTSEEEDAATKMQQKPIVFAVLGAGHLKGVAATLQELLQPMHSPSKGSVQSSDLQQGPAEREVTAQAQSSKEVPDQQAEARPAKAIPSLESLEFIPRKKTLNKLLPWAFPLLIACFIAVGFYQASYREMLEGIWVWVISHSALAGLMGILSLAHPLSILTAIVAAPFTALTPTISVGIVTALVESLLRKPRVSDFEGLFDLKSWKDWHKNRIWHILVIMTAVSTGGALAKLIVLPWLGGLFF